jgi:hypothetical protein
MCFFQKFCIFFPAYFFRGNTFLTYYAQNYTEHSISKINHWGARVADNS